jgi:hypothetical protein
MPAGALKHSAMSFGVVGYNMHQYGHFVKHYFSMYGHFALTTMDIFFLTLWT